MYEGSVQKPAHREALHQAVEVLLDSLRELRIDLCPVLLSKANEII